MFESLGISFYFLLHKNFNSIMCQIFEAGNLFLSILSFADSKSLNSKTLMLFIILEAQEK